MKNARLFLFSDHQIAANHGLDLQVLDAVGKRSPTVAWIPAGSRPEKTTTFFEARREYYSRLGVADVSMFCLHTDFRHDRIPWLLSCDVIHLSGGDPFLFLKYLRKTGMLEVLRNYALSGGVMVGDSAGAMLMCHDIEIARFGQMPVPTDLLDLSALGLVDFEFHPHFGTYGATHEQLCEYSKKRGAVILAVPDGAGVALVGEAQKIHGPVVRFAGGKEEPNQPAQPTRGQAPRG